MSRYGRKYNLRSRVLSETRLLLESSNFGGSGYKAETIVQLAFGLDPVATNAQGNLMHTPGGSDTDVTIPGYTGEIEVKAADRYVNPETGNSYGINYLSAFEGLPLYMPLEVSQTRALDSISDDPEGTTMTNQLQSYVRSQNPQSKSVVPGKGGDFRDWRPARIPRGADLYSVEQDSYMRPGKKTKVGRFKGSVPGKGGYTQKHIEAIADELRVYLPDHVMTPTYRAVNGEYKIYHVTKEDIIDSTIYNQFIPYNNFGRPAIGYEIIFGEPVKTLSHEDWMAWISKNKITEQTFTNAGKEARHWREFIR